MTQDQLIASAEALLLREIVSIINTYGLTQVPAGETHPELERLRELVDLAAASGKTEPAAKAWVTVPVEPTLRMLRAADEREGTGQPFADIYRSMVAAAPDLTTEPGDFWRAVEAYVDARIAVRESDRDTYPEAEDRQRASKRVLSAFAAAPPEAEPVAAALREEARNELARRQEAGHDARVPLTGPEKFRRFSDDELRALSTHPGAP